MNTESIAITAADSTSLPCLLWTPDTAPIAVLQITHGMTEHAGRYHALAEILTANGIAAAAFDLRGHGRHSDGNRCASLGENGRDKSLSDMRCLSDMLRARFGQLPLFHLGFSLGSFLLREYLGKTDDAIGGAVILGTGHQPPAVLSLMCAIVKTQIRRVGIDGTTPLIQKLSFDTYNTRFKPNRTSFDWLCADPGQLDAYLADPLCRDSISAGLFYELLSAMKRTADPALYEKSKNIPILLLSGACDPVGDMGGGVARVEKILRRAGASEVHCVLYPDARHDLLHEYACGAAGEAQRQIVDFILSHLSHIPV